MSTEKALFKYVQILFVLIIYILALGNRLKGIFLNAPVVFSNYPIVEYTNSKFLSRY